MPRSVGRSPIALPYVLALTLPLYCCKAMAETVVNFDVQNGEHEELFEGPLSVGQMITCKFALQKIDKGYKSSSHIEMVFYPDTPEESAIFDGELVNLIAYRTTVNSFLSAREHWHYEVHVQSAATDDSHSVSSAAGREPVHTLTLALPTESSVLVLVGDDADDMSIIDVPHMGLDRWKVLASGMKGEVSCTDKIGSLASTNDWTWRAFVDEQNTVQSLLH